MPPISNSLSRRGGRTWFVRPFRLTALAAALATCACFVAGLHAQQSKPEEYQVQAVYLYNFGKFVSWPESAKKDDSFAICILGVDPFGSILDTTLAREVIDNKRLVTRRIGSAREAGPCRILFISAAESPRIKDIMGMLEKTSVLTVSDMPNFTTDGGMIQFVLKDNKVRFEVNLTAAERAGITISSQLLKVASDVRRVQPAPDVTQ